MLYTDFEVLVDSHTFVLIQTDPEYTLPKLPHGNAVQNYGPVPQPGC